MYDLEWDDVEEDTLPGSTLRHGRVLVADDDEAIRALIVSRLLDDGHQVAEVDTGVQALTEISEPKSDRPYDLLVIDQRMPGIVGLDVIRELRAEGERVAAILMTAFPEPELVAEAGALSVPILAKPFSLFALSRLATRVLHVGQPGAR